MKYSLERDRNNFNENQLAAKVRDYNQYEEVHHEGTASVGAQKVFDKIFERISEVVAGCTFVKF